MLLFWSGAQRQSFYAAKGSFASSSPSFGVLMSFFPWRTDAEVINPALSLSILRA